jgi:hypothetical protein
MSKPQIIEFDYYISPDGKVYNFHNGRDKFLMSFSDTGMPSIEYIEQQAVYQHGVSLLGYRLKKRIIQYIHRRSGCDRDDYWNNRDDIINFLRLNRQSAGTFALGKLRSIRPDKTIRDIDVLVMQGPGFSPRSMDEHDEFGFTEAIRFIAPDPTFYNPDIKTVTWDYSPTYTELVFPTEEVINYPGTWLSYPDIIITGPMIGFTITNDSTGDTLHLNYSIAVGETVTIILEFGNKTVEGSVDVYLSDPIITNLIGVLDGDLTDFSIVPDPTAPGGVNTFTITGSGIGAGTTVTMKYYERDLNR